MKIHLQSSLGISIESVFFLGFTTMLSAFLLSLFLKEIPLRDKTEGPKTENDKSIEDVQGCHQRLNLRYMTKKIIVFHHKLKEFHKSELNRLKGF